MTDFDVNLNGKLVRVTLSDAGQKSLSSSSASLLIDVELYFSCLIKKICRIRKIEGSSNYTRVTDGLYINFRATMTNKCAIEDFDKGRAADFPIVNQKPYIPRWVSLDFSGNTWHGEFGYAEKY